MNCWWWIFCQYQLPTKSSLSMLVLTWWGMSCSLMSTIQSRGFVLITESEKQCVQERTSIFGCTCCCAPCSAPRASRCRRSLPSPSRGSSWKRTPDLGEPGLGVSHCTRYIPKNIYTFWRALTLQIKLPPWVFEKKSLNNGMAMMRKVKKPVPKFYASVYIESSKGPAHTYFLFFPLNHFQFSNFLGFIWCRQFVRIRLRFGAAAKAFSLQ